jgi:hypothetical protein
MKTITLSNCVDEGEECLFTQLAAAHTWAGDDSKKICLQFLLFDAEEEPQPPDFEEDRSDTPRTPIVDALDFLTPALGRAIVQLFEHMARQGHVMQLALSGSSSACTRNSSTTRTFQYVLKRARQLGILRNLVMSLTPSSNAITKKNNYDLWTSSNTLLFEILAKNGRLETVEVNLPASATAELDDLRLARRLGTAIAANPAIRTLSLYTYQDDRGTATAALLQALVPSSSCSTTNCTARSSHLQTLQLYCPKSATPIVVGKGLVPLLASPYSQLRELEISCIRHHRNPTTAGVLLLPHHHQQYSSASSFSSTTTATPLVFPLATLVQEGLLCNVYKNERSNSSTGVASTSMLQRLGIFHADLTTAQVDRDLLCWLHQLPSLQMIDLFGNQIEKLQFTQFQQQPYPCRLQELHLQQNPCLYNFFYPQQCSYYYYKPPQQQGLSEMLSTLFQRHPRLYHFGVALPTQSSQSQYHHHHHHTPSSPLFWADANRVRVVRQEEQIIVQQQPQQKTIIPRAVWPQLLERITHHPTLMIHPSFRKRKSNKTSFHHHTQEARSGAPSTTGGRGDGGTRRRIMKPELTIPSSTTPNDWTTAMSTAATRTSGAASTSTSSSSRSSGSSLQSSQQAATQPRPSHHHQGCGRRPPPPTAPWKKQPFQEEQEHRRQRQASLLFFLLRNQDPSLWTIKR